MWEKQVISHASLMKTGIHVSSYDNWGVVDYIKIDMYYIEERHLISNGVMKYFNLSNIAGDDINISLSPNYSISSSL